MPRRSAFTLIELLIVVAILGILAAIAVPNFMNAMIRAKIAQVQEDFHTIGNAMEMYRIDHSNYPNRIITFESLITGKIIQVNQYTIESGRNSIRSLIPIRFEKVS